jgi:hypothetical protein
MFSDLEPFIKQHYWCDSTSVNIFRVVGTQHPDYAEMSWIKLLEKGKRMHLNLRLYAENPGYYYEDIKKEPPMYFKSIDGDNLYIGEDGNHRTCIARCVFYLAGRTTLHGVTVNDYRIDWDFKKVYEQIVETIQKKGMPYIVKPIKRAVSREDSAGWMLERYENLLFVKDLKNGSESEIYAEDAGVFLETLQRPGWVRRLFLSFNPLST